MNCLVTLAVHLHTAARGGPLDDDAIGAEFLDLHNSNASSGEAVASDILLRFYGEIASFIGDQKAGRRPQDALPISDPTIFAVEMLTAHALTRIAPREYEAACRHSGS